MRLGPCQLGLYSASRGGNRCSALGPRAPPRPNKPPSQPLTLLSLALESQFYPDEDLECHHPRRPSLELMTHPHSLLPASVKLSRRGMVGRAQPSPLACEGLRVKGGAVIWDKEEGSAPAMVP